MNRRSLFSGLAALAVAPLAGPVTAAIEKRRRQEIRIKMMETLVNDRAKTLAGIRESRELLAKVAADWARAATL